MGFDLILGCRSDFGLQIRIWAAADFFRESPFSSVGVGENLMLDKDSKNG